MLTNLPIRPRSRNSMMPGILANSVSSLPRPTLTPGLMRVPRCRTMMVPPVTNWPPNALIPKRCALESRPFLELPKPFLCAMTNDLRYDLIHLHARVILAMPDGALVLLLALELEDDGLIAAALRCDGALHARAAER